RRVVLTRESLLRGHGRSLRNPPGGIGPPGAPRLVPPALSRLQSRRDAGAFGADRCDLVGRKAAALDPRLQQLVVFEPPGAVGRDHDVELLVVRIDALSRPVQRLLEVHVPARERAFGALAERPHGVGVAGTVEGQRPMPVPASAALAPRVPAVPRPAAGRELEPGSLGNVDRKQLGIVANDAAALDEPRRPAPDFPPDDLVARLPTT